MTYSMKWDKFAGRVKGEHGEATCEMMDLHEPNWFCRFFRRSDEAIELAVQQFEEGELEQAHDWCTQKVKEHDERTGITAGAA